MKQEEIFTKLKLNTYLGFIVCKKASLISKTYLEGIEWLERWNSSFTVLDGAYLKERGIMRPLDPKGIIDIIITVEDNYNDSVFDQNLHRCRARLIKRLSNMNTIFAKVNDFNLEEVERIPGIKNISKQVSFKAN